MKRKDILIALGIIAACIGSLYLYSFTDKLVHGYIELDSGGAKAELMLRGSFFSRDFKVTEIEPEFINTRVTRPKSLVISKTQDSNSLRLVSYGPWGDLSGIKIKNDKTLKLRVGPPLIIKPSVSNYSGIVSVGFAVFGQAGERYDIPRLSPAPKLKIMDENGKILTSSNFSYG